jgi:hypothetical protein
VSVRRSDELCDDAGEPVAIVVVERGLHVADGVAAVWFAGHGDGAGALRHDPVEALEIGSLGADHGSSGVDFAVGELSVSAGVRPGVRELAAVVAVDAVAGLGIAVFGAQSRCFPKTEALKVCAARVPAPANRPVVSTRGYWRRPRSADFPADRSCRPRCAAHHTVAHGYAAVW